MRKPSNFFAAGSRAVAGACCLLLCVAFVAACGGDDDDDHPSTAGSGAGAGGTIGGSSGTAAGTSGSSTAGTSGAGTGGTSGTSGAGTGGSKPPAMMCPSAGCPKGQFCVDNKCVDKCTEDAQCGTGDKCCDGVCADPMTDRDNCGACGTACDETERCVESTCTALMCALDFDGGVELEANGCPDNERCVEKSGDGACMCGDGPSCPAPETCSGDGDCMCNDDAGCASAETCCGDGCQNLKTDEDNCGKCGNQCATGASCNNGTCECDTAGYGDCNGKCVALDTSTNCGECGNSCPAPSTCRDPSGARPLDCYCPNVNDVACNGVCVALGTVDNCGSCGDSCDAPTTTCRNSHCECPIAGETKCGNTCVNLNTGVDTDSSGNTLIKHCGECNLTCLANAACNSGECACPGNPTTDKYCDENPITGATDGVFACTVVNTTKSCGDCGLACIDDSECRTRTPTDAPDDFSCVCVGSDAGKTHCPGIGCRNLTNDEDSCGSCGHVCPEGIACTGRNCQCPGGNSVCPVDGEPKCVDLDADEANCGACGTKCGSGFECCNGDCIDVDDYQTDTDNCGTCGNTCNAFACLFVAGNCCSAGKCP